MKEILKNTFKKLILSRKGLCFLSCFFLNIYCTIFSTVYALNGEKEIAYCLTGMAVFYMVCELIVLKIIQIDKIKIGVNYGKNN